MLPRKSRFPVLLALLTLAGCNGSVSASSAPQPFCAPNCGKADGLDAEGAAARLWILPEHAWAAPLDIEPISVPAEVVIEGAYAKMAEDPLLSAFEAAQLAVVDAVGRPDLEASDFGPLIDSAVETRSWGSLGLPALVASEIDGDRFSLGAVGLVSQTRHADEVLDVAHASKDPIAYAEIANQLANANGVSSALAGRLLEFSRQVTLGEPRFMASGRMRTLEDFPDRPVAEVIEEMAASEVGHLRRSAFRGAEKFGLLTAQQIDDALADDDFRVRSAASAYFFEGSETSESAQAAFLARLDDPRFVAAVRLDVIRSMGFSDLYEDRFADEPAGLAEALALYRGAVIGQMLQAVPSNHPLIPLAELASQFASVDPVGRDLLHTLRRNTTLTADEKAPLVRELLYVEHVRDDACSFLFEQLYIDGTSAEVAELARPCMWQLEQSPDSNVREDFETEYSLLQGTVAQRRAAMLRLGSVEGWHSPVLTSALLRMGAYAPDEALEIALSRAGVAQAQVVGAYVDGGGSSEGLVDLLQAFVGDAQGTQRRSAAVYHVAPELLLRAGVRGDMLAEIVAEMLSTPSESAYPLWRVFLLGGEAYEADDVVDDLFLLLAHPTVSDEAMLDALSKIAAPDGVAANSQVLRYMTRAGVDPRFVARVRTAFEVANPPQSAATYLSHITPATRAPDFDPDLVSFRLDAMQAFAQRYASELPPEDEVDVWLGGPRQDPGPLQAGEAVQRVLARATDGESNDRADVLASLRDLTYAQGVGTLSEDEVEEVHTALDWEHAVPEQILAREVGLMLLDCQRGAGYDLLRDRYRETLPLRWDLGDAVRDVSESAALLELLTRVGDVFGTGRFVGRTGEVCALGADIPSDKRHALAAEALAQHSDLNGTYNKDSLEALLEHEHFEFSSLHPAMLRRMSVMASFNDGFDPLLERWVQHPGVPTEHALELLTLAATMGRRGLDQRLREDFPSIVRAFIEREDVSAEDEHEALLLVAALRHD